MEPLEHQREAHDEIVRRMRAFFAGEWQDLPVIPRWPSLLLGPTGTGKTAVAAIAADTLTRALPGLDAVKMLRVSAPSWMPAGANNRGTKETIRVVAKHVATHDRSILVLDEIDKLLDRGGDTSWKTYIRAELFDLLDGRWPAGLVDDDDDEITIEALTRKLRDTVFVLGIGTFQNWFDGAGSRRSMGFGAETSHEKNEISADVVAENLPRELANRFNSNLIRLPELTPNDYRRVANEVENQLPLRMREAFRAEVNRLIPGAIAAKKGVRFVEEAMLAVLVGLPPQPGKITAEFVAKEPQTKTRSEPCMLW